MSVMNLAFRRGCWRPSWREDGGKKKKRKKRDESKEDIKMEYLQKKNIEN